MGPDRSGSKIVPAGVTGSHFDRQIQNDTPTRLNTAAPQPMMTITVGRTSLTRKDMQMLRGLIDQVVEAISAPESEQTAESRENAVHKATAVLMVEVARADHVFAEDELMSVLGLIENHFQLDPESAATLFNSANETAEDSVSLHEFTQLLHENLNDPEKEKVVSLLWQIAYADGTLDKFEDSLVLKISDLLHVNRARVMRLKHDAGEGAA